MTSTAVEVALARATLASDITACTRCDVLREDGVGPVPFAGRAPAPVLVVMESPSVENDVEGGWLKVGRPGPGSSVTAASPQIGLLFRGLDRAGIVRGDVAIMGTVQCAPKVVRGVPDALKVHQIAACAGFRKRVVDLVNPTWIVTCGATATKAFLPRKIKITSDHGKWWQGTVGPAIGRKVFLSYHPHAGVKSEKAERDFTDDLRGLGAMMRGDVGEMAKREMRL